MVNSRIEKVKENLGNISKKNLGNISDTKYDEERLMMGKVVSFCLLSFIEYKKYDNHGLVVNL